MAYIIHNANGVSTKKSVRAGLKSWRTYFKYSAGLNIFLILIIISLLIYKI